MPTGIYPRTEKHSFNKGRKHPNRKKYFKGLTTTEKKCEYCSDIILVTCLFPKKRFCNRSCSSKHKTKVLGINNTQHVDREKQKESAKQIRGEKHPRWIKDRTKVIGRHVRHFHSSDYKIWRKKVCDRDGWKCRLKNTDCRGRLEVHHILPWKDHENLRHDVNNGICLCHYHHPKTRQSEKEMAPLFQEMLKSV